MNKFSAIYLFSTNNSFHFHISGATISTSVQMRTMEIVQTFASICWALTCVHARLALSLTLTIIHAMILVRQMLQAKYQTKNSFAFWYKSGKSVKCEKNRKKKNHHKIHSFHFSADF